MARTARYKKLAEFKHYVDRERAAGREPVTIMLDNDQCAAYDGDLNEDIYDTDPYDLLREALDMLGIPHEEV
jgi:hypothetical protein